MRSKRAVKIPTQADRTPLVGVGGAFSNLGTPADFPPDSEPTPDAPVSLPTWKMGRVVLRREKSHRGGKTVIVLDDFATHLPASVIETVAKKLRAACGCGGTVKNRTVEIQGDQPAKIRSLLEAEGFEVAGVR